MPRIAALCVVGGILIGICVAVAGLFLFANPAAQQNQLTEEHPTAPEVHGPERAEQRDGAAAQPDGARVEAEPHRQQDQADSNAEAMTQAYIQQMFRAAEQQRQQDEHWRRFMNDLNRCNACGGTGSYSYMDAYGRLVSRPCPYCNGLGSDALIK